MRRAASAALLALALIGCERPAGNTNPPDAFLQDSLGFGADERVHRVVLGSRENDEFVEPAEVAVEPGAWVEFFTDDGRVRTVRFTLDSLSAEQASFLTSTAQAASPPLIERESRFLVSFVEAPPGRYPFVVDGNQRAIPGAVVVAPPQP